MADGVWEIPVCMARLGVLAEAGDSGARVPLRFNSVLTPGARDDGAPAASVAGT